MSSETGDEAVDPGPTGDNVLAYIWFCTMSELHTSLHSDDARTRLEAASTLLQYFTAMGQSINAPYIPGVRPSINIEELDELDEDE